jgi:Histidine kinase-, DNA gyrase B-, and HSP90-like ATPase
VRHHREPSLDLGHVGKWHCPHSWGSGSNSAGRSESDPERGRGNEFATRQERTGISAEQDRANALVAVRDSGPGIDPKHLERVFEAFHTTKSGGMGIGLSICKSIIIAHGGRLWAAANEPQGALFQFVLPNAETTALNREIGEPHEDIAVNAPRPPACEGSK